MGPSVSFPLPLRIAQKLPIRSSWEFIFGKLPIPLPIFYYFELIRDRSISEHTVFEGSASLFWITWKVSVAIFVVRGSWSSVE